MALVLFAAVSEQCFSRENEEVAMKYFDKIKSGVEKNDYSWIASKFKYPICLDINCREVEVTTPKGFLEHKDKIFTENIRKCVLDQKRDDLGEKYGLYMIAQGEIWFDPRGYIQNVANNSGYSVMACSGVQPKPLPRKYYGPWKVYRCESVGGSMSTELVKGSIGKKIFINNGSFGTETELFPGLENVEWIVTETPFTESEGPPAATIGWYDTSDAFLDKTVMIDACVDGQEHLHLEITAKDELALYWDGFLVFLKRVK
jgi:hypothetical protein